MSDLGNTLHTIHSHLLAFDRHEMDMNMAKMLAKDNALLQTVDQTVIDKQTLDLANQIMKQLNQLNVSQRNLLTKPNVAAQTQVAAHLDKETKVMKERLRSILKKPPVPSRAIEKNYKPKT